MGVILFELTYNYHPWKFSINPWRNGNNEELRPFFEENYESAIGRMSRDYQNASTSPAKGYIHRKCSFRKASMRTRWQMVDSTCLVGGHFIDMVRHPWAANNHAQRLDINQVLQHPAWGPLLPDSPQPKRWRLENDVNCE